MKKILIILLTILVLAGCSKEVPVDGKVPVDEFYIFTDKKVPSLIEYYQKTNDSNSVVYRIEDEGTIESIVKALNNIKAVEKTYTEDSGKVDVVELVYQTGQRVTVKFAKNVFLDQNGEKWICSDELSVLKGILNETASKANAGIYEDPDVESSLISEGHTIIDKNEIDASKILSEKDIYKLIRERGFEPFEGNVYGIYEPNGENVEAIINEEGDNKYLMYEFYVYIPEKDTYWLMDIINGEIFAVNISKDLSENSKYYIVSEKDTVLSYDEQKRMFYEVKLNEGYYEVNIVDLLDNKVLIENS